MAYTKINWNEQTPLNSTNLNKMETQYEEILTELSGTRAATTELIAYVVTADPAVSEGSIIYNTTEERWKYSTDTEWKDLAVEGSDTL